MYEKFASVVFLSVFWFYHFTKRRKGNRKRNEKKNRINKWTSKNDKKYCFQEQYSSLMQLNNKRKIHKKKLLLLLLVSWLTKELCVPFISDCVRAVFSFYTFWYVFFLFLFVNETNRYYIHTFTLYSLIFNELYFNLYVLYLAIRQGQLLLK